MADNRKPEETGNEAAHGGKERAWYEEKVAVRLFKDADKYRDDVFAAVNGKTFLIQRGVEVMVPRYVAQVLQQSQDQDFATAIMMDRQEAEFAEASKAHGVE